MSFDFEELEQEDKIREIENEIESLRSQINAGLDTESGGDDEIGFSRLLLDDKRQVIVHWIKWGQIESYTSCEEIQTIEDAKKAIREAAQFRDNIELGNEDVDGEVCRPVEHGDLLVLPCSPCTYIAYCAVVDMDKGPGYAGFQQKDHSGVAETEYDGGEEEEDRFKDPYRDDIDEYLVRREFLLWNVSGDVNSIEIPIGRINVENSDPISSEGWKIEVEDLDDETEEEVNLASLTVSQAAGAAANLIGLTGINNEDEDPCEDPPAWDEGVPYLTGDYVVVEDNGVKRYFFANLEHTAEQILHPTICDGTVDPNCNNWTEVTKEDWCDDLSDQAQAFRDANAILKHAREVNIGSLEVVDEDPEPLDSPQYDFGIYELEDEGTPIEISALTSIDSLDIVSTPGGGGGGSFKAAAPELVDTENNWIAWKEVTATCNQPDCVDDWDIDVTYNPGDDITYEGKCYRNKQTTNTTEPQEGDDTFWEEIPCPTVPTDCLVFKPIKAQKKKHKFTGSTVGYSAGTSTISGAGQAKKITVTPKTYKLDQKSIIFTQQRKLLQTANTKATLSNHLQKLTFNTQPFSLTGTNTQILQELKKLKLTSKKLLVKTETTQGEIVDTLVSIFSGKASIYSTPCGGIGVSIGASIGSSLYGKSLTFRGFIPDLDTPPETDEIELLSASMELETLGSNSFNVGGSSVTTGAQQAQEIDLELSSISVQEPVPGSSIIVPNLTLKNGDPCKDPEEWDETKTYNVGDWVIRNGNYYQAIAYHVGKDPSMFNQDVVVNEWAANTSYVQNASLVIYNQNTYFCINTHVSGATFDDNLADWQGLTEDEALPWAQKGRDVYCQDTDNQDDLIPRITNSEIVVEDAPGTAFSGAGPSSSVLTAPVPLPDVEIEHFVPTGQGLTDPNYEPGEGEKNVYLPYLDNCPSSGVSIATLSGDHPISLAMTSRAEMVEDYYGNTSCSLIIENEIKYRKKQFEIKCGVLTNTQCEEEVVVTNEAVIDAFTAQKFSEVTLTKVYKTAGIQVCDGSTTKTLDLVHVNNTGSDDCIGWIIPCDAFSASNTAPKMLVPDGNGTISLLSLDCS